MRVMEARSLSHLVEKKNNHAHEGIKTQFIQPVAFNFTQLFLL
jgi:hypothetical protein